MALSLIVESSICPLKPAPAISALSPAPRLSNRVEITYFTLPNRQGEDIAGRTARQLVSMTKSEMSEIEIFAKAIPEQNACKRILQRLGFKMTGTPPDSEIGTAWVWLFQKGGRVLQKFPM